MIQFITLLGIYPKIEGRLIEILVRSCSQKHYSQWLRHRGNPRVHWQMNVSAKSWYVHTVTYSVQFSHSVVSNSLQPHGLQHARAPCLSPTPGVYSNSCPSSLWCYPTISSSVIPFSSHLQSFPTPGSFQLSLFFTAGGQRVGISASASVLPMNIQDGSPLG